ncbi:methyltransferase domain-containing protein [Archangium sp.]|uniref:class I SAM-dependent methyltransferase n=1 Tax=Archangium sp. TaxID=1872627 RepID=UPI00286BA81B|nr:methyltransferase domain-containing protein [Archangium sp.]
MGTHDTFEAFRKFEHEGWLAVAKEYGDSFGSLTTQAAQPLLNATEAGFGTRLLDIACGPGYVAATASKLGAIVTGLDFSATMIQLAREHHSDVEFVEGDAENLPFPSGMFGAVTINFGMLHFAHPDRVLLEAFRVLKPGGKLAYTAWATPEKAEVLGIVSRAIEKHGNMNVHLPPAQPVFRFSDHHESVAAMQSAGFINNLVVEIPMVWHLPSVNAILTAMHDATVRTRQLLRSQTAEVLSKIRQTIAEETRHYQTATGAEIPMIAVLSSGRKP